MNKRAAQMSTSKVLAIALSAMAISLGTAGKARADEAAPPSATPDEGQVVQQILHLDRAEERTAEAVKPRLGSPEAWNLAERIDVDYTALDKDLLSLSGTPASTEPAGASADLGELSNLSGDALDKAYVDHEIKTHQATLAAIDAHLLGPVKTDGVRRGLVQLRSEATAHLAQARDIQRAEQARQMAAEERALISQTINSDM
jgi:putative membrane protein